MIVTLHSGYLRENAKGKFERGREPGQLAINKNQFLCASLLDTQSHTKVQECSRNEIIF